MLFDKIIYINLDRRPDRNQNVIDQLKKLNLDSMSERFSAIDGKKLNLDEIDSKIITKQGIEDAKKSDVLYTHLTPGAIGCAMSHQAIYQKIVNENIVKCLILEDDITFVDDFNKKIEELEKKITNDYDLFFLGYHGVSQYDIINITPNNIHKFITIYGLFGYIVTKKGAQKLLDLYPITLQIDSEITNNSENIDIYGVDRDSRLILSDPSQQSYKFGTDIQVKNQDKKVENFTDNNSYIDYLVILIFIILCGIILKIYYL
jgi:glycosyl transferase family 25